jgi:hypothetical protein
MKRMAQPSESELEIARRHVKEAEARLVRQETIVAEMERANRPDDVELGRRLVDTLRTSLRLARAHVERLEKGASNLWWANEHRPGIRTAQNGNPPRPP